MPRFFVTTTIGFEPELARELRALTDRPVVEDSGRVHVEGPWDLVYDLNHAVRVGQRVFLTAAEGEVETLDDVERLTRDVPWESVFPREKRFAVRGQRLGEHPFTSMDVARRVGDGVIRRFQDAGEERPPVDLNAPQVELFALLRNRSLLIGVNTSGPSLHFRSYKTREHPAPLSAHLAAALLHMCGYADAPGPLGDPLTGTATVPIEAALLARGTPPGRFRPDFHAWRPPSPGEDEAEESPHRGRAVRAQHPEGYLFGNLHGYDAAAWDAARHRHDASVREAAPPIWGNDRKSRHLASAREHAANAGVLEDLTFTARDARRVDAPFPLRFAVLNPPYGVRVGQKDSLDRLYAQLHERLETWAQPGPLSAAVIVGNRRFEKATDREPTWARDATYGRLVVRLLKYDL